MFTKPHMKTKATIGTILVVEDDRKTADLIRLYLEKSHFRSLNAYDGREGLELFHHNSPLDLIILDIMLPHLDGLELCRLIRSESDVPIIMLTARSTEPDKLVGLEIGADDYIAKPFSPRELVARVRAVLRRTKRAQADESPLQLEIHDLYIDFSRHEVRVADKPIHLTIKEFRLLETLAGHPGQTFSRAQLLERVFGYDYLGLERTVDVHIKNLRKKIEPDPTQPSYIQTVYGVGYKFSEELPAHA